jgi:low temperature requirement protein LtrA
VQASRHSNDSATEPRANAREESPLLRQRDHSDAGRVSTVELFFDLVFVFAVTQLSHTLIGDLTSRGALHVGLLLLAMWWVWIYTSWVTNWLDPERLPVRACLFVLMVAGLVLSVSIPRAFGDRGLHFAGAYAFMQVGRTIFFLWAVRSGPEVLVRNFQRILVWLSASALCWLAGGLAETGSRYGWWLLAVGIEFAGPWLYFAVPGLGRSTTYEWNIHGGHMAERCGLFVIIALGESLLVTGATFADLPWNDEVWIAFIVAVLSSILLWWIYFDTGAQRGEHRITHSDDPGRIARLGYTYLHLPIIAGIIVCAVGDEITLLHPGHVTAVGMAVLIGGPACFVAGATLFKWVTNYRRTPPLSHMAGLVLLAVVAGIATSRHWSALAIGAATTGVLLVVATWEAFALRRPVKA